MTGFTAKQVQEHSSKEDCWLIIEDKVYDVTKFLEDHPGGEEVLTELAGQNATEEFEEIGHSPDARDLLKQFLVGTLEGKPKEKQVPESRKVHKYPTEPASAGLTILIPFAVVVAGFVYYKFFMSTQ